MNTIFRVLLTAAGLLLATASDENPDRRNADSIVAHILGAIGVKRDDDAAGTIAEMNFSVVTKDIHYVSIYAFAALICLTNADKQRPFQPDPHILNLGVEELKPIVIDKIDLSLGSGPVKYGVTFKEFAVDGFINITVNRIRSNPDRSLRFDLTFAMRKLSVTVSSEVLIMSPVTGGGAYWVEFEEIAVKVYMVATEVVRDSKTYLRLERLEIDVSLEHVQMGLKNTNNSNDVLESALNLFIDAYAFEFLEQIKPHVRDKLVVVVNSFVRNWFDLMPVDNSPLYCNPVDSR